MVYQWFAYGQDMARACRSIAFLFDRRPAYCYYPARRIVMVEVVDFSGSDFSKSSDLARMVNNFMTVENWREQSMERDAAGFEYLEGTEHVVRVLEIMIDLELPFEELKNQLTGLVKERRNMIEYANMHAP